MKLDTQQIEIIGRNLLISIMISEDIEIAQPLRDRGVDLIAFSDLNENKQFHAIPIQLKTFSKRGFNLYSKYDKFPNLVLAYLWFARNPEKAKLYIMNYHEAWLIARRLGWTKTDSWIKKGSYSNSNPSKKILEELNPYLYKPGELRTMIKGLS